MTRVFWDTNLFIYLLEGGPFGRRVAELRNRMQARGDLLITSTVTLAEFLVKPATLGAAAVQEHRHALRQIATVVPFDEQAAMHYATIRANRTIAPPDAIQLACAAAAGVDLFITNDDRLAAKVVPGVKFVTSLERSFL